MTPALPGTIPGLLRRGSPVRIHDRDSVNIPHHLRDKSGTVHRIAPCDDLGGVMLASVAVDGCETMVACALDVLDLDLTDPTGRAHAAWWIDSIASLPEPTPAGRAAYWRAYVTAYPNRSADVVEWAFCQDFGTRGEILGAIRAFNAPDLPSEGQIALVRRLILAAANLKESP